MPCFGVCVVSLFCIFSALFAHKYFTVVSRLSSVRFGRARSTSRPLNHGEINYYEKSLWESVIYTLLFLGIGESRISSQGCGTGFRATELVTVFA